MENRANPFYELYDRLYAAAAAGTAVIAEDFRLKRAIDAFEPLAQKNKVFARLHTMCAALMTSEKAPADIVDCIALAEALAVTQGVFLDSSETTPAKVGGFAPHDIPYSQLTELIDAINKAKNSPKDFPADLAKYADDPRLVSAFIENCDANSENFGRLAKVFISKCASALAEPLFESIDLNDPKATGRQIEFIAEIAGCEYTDRFRQLAFDENAPAGVRVRAVTALSLSEEYSDDIIELYRTSSGKVNIAALEAIARISPPEGEAIFEKLAEKFKAAYINAFSIAKYPVCSQLARSELAKSIDKPWVDFPVKIANMLCGKTDVYDCFDKLAQRAPKYGGYGQLLERILLSNITHSSDPTYTAMIGQLYKKYPDTMFFTKLVSDIMVKGEAAFELPGKVIEKNIDKFVYLIDNISTPDDGYARIKGISDSKDCDGYHLTMWKMNDAPKVKDILLFTSIPDKLLEILSETPPDCGKGKYQTRCDSLERLLSRECLRADFKKVGRAATKFVYECSRKHPSIGLLERLLNFDMNIPEGDICRSVVGEVIETGKAPNQYSLLYFNKKMNYDDRVAAEYKQAAEMIAGMKKELTGQQISAAVEQINKTLDAIARTKK